MSLPTHMHNTVYSEPRITEEIRDQWKWFLSGGIISMVLGLLAVMFPIIASVTISLFLGWILIFAGVAQSIHAFRVKKWSGFSFTLLGGVVGIIVGAMLILYPGSGVAALTLLVAGFLIASGVFRTVTAVQVRPNDHWGWLLASGILAIILALLVIFQFPLSALWFIGFLVGMDLIFTGAWLVMVAMTAKRYLNA